MPIKMCYVCDMPIERREPRILISGVLIHEYCAPERGVTCDTANCMWRWTVHSGECVV